uniref:Immunoglobulin domain-containing protein n=1 Tax=Takifugu rubripes TaxID=31033 RepID=A0A674MMG4_TAKRU
MALHLSISLLLTGLTGQSLGVTRVSVKAGDSVSIPCLYHPKYTSHVKYLCQGYYYEFCSYAVKTNWQSSGRFLISDDREKKVFTVTIKDVREGDTDFWCIVEINRELDDRTYFQMSVTRGKNRTLYVDHQEVTGFIGEQTTIKCYYQNSGQAKWCRVGGPCVTPSQGSIDGTTVFINETPPRVFTVTMSGLKMEDSGWYWCSRGDLQMPVQIIVREKPSTSKFCLFHFSNVKQDMACPEDEVIYSKMKTKPESSHRVTASAAFIKMHNFIVIIKIKIFFSAFSLSHCVLKMKSPIVP